jgi:AraC family transcriptional regulator, transcriptional activator of pobA
MIAEFREGGNGALLRLIEQEKTFRQNYFEQAEGFNTHTIAWNRGAPQVVKIDEVDYHVGTNTIIPLMLNQSFSFSRPEDVAAVQFNRDFYCIINHDEEVGCVGFLFFGPSPVMLISPEEGEVGKLEQLLEHFREEMRSNDSTKAAMLRMLLVQYIIMLTRLSKRQYLTQQPEEEQFNLLRKFNLLVEIHFRKEKQVKFYAAQLHKSPKTLSNLFSNYCKKSPLTIIHERVVAEAKRLIYYTDKSIKEIAAELGFEDVSHFSKFIKGYTAHTPTQLKKTKEEDLTLPVSE